MDLEILSDLGRKRTYDKKNFFWGFRNQGVMKRGEMQKKIYDFCTDYHTIVLNVKVKIHTGVADTIRTIFYRLRNVSQL